MPSIGGSLLVLFFVGWLFVLGCFCGWVFAGSGLAFLVGLVRRSPPYTRRLFFQSARDCPTH